MTSEAATESPTHANMFCNNRTHSPQLKILQYFSRVMSDDFEKDYNRTHNMSDELRLRDFSFFPKVLGSRR